MAKRKNKRKEAWEYASTHAQFTVSEVANAVSMSLEQCRAAIMIWLNKGYLRYLTGTGKSGDSRKYSIVPDAEPQFGGVCRIRAKTKRQKIWNSMKISRVFTVQSVMVTSESSHVGALSYINMLEKSGYVKKLSQTETGRLHPSQVRQFATYQLIRDTGRRAPATRKDGCFDQNELVFYPFKKGDNDEQDVA